MRKGEIKLCWLRKGKQLEAWWAGYFLGQREAGISVPGLFIHRVSPKKPWIKCININSPWGRDCNFCPHFPPSERGFFFPPIAAKFVLFCSAEQL